MTDPGPKRIFIIDDHPLLRAGIARVIEEESDFTVSGEAGSVEEALAAIEDSPPDFLIVDISLEDGNGIDLIRQLKRDGYTIPSLMVSMFDEPVYIERAFRAGAGGYLLKRESVQKVTTAIRTILKGKNYVSESVASALVDALRSTDTDGDVCPREILSQRECEVFELLGRGSSRKEIADLLNISLKTVESHVERMKEKLHLDSGPQLVHYAAKHTSRK